MNITFTSIRNVNAMRLFAGFRNGCVMDCKYKGVSDKPKKNKNLNINHFTMKLLNY